MRSECGLSLAGEISPSSETLLSFLGSVALSRPEIANLVDDVRAALARWPEFADEAGVHSVQTAEIGAAHRVADERVGPLQ